ncbi:MAG: hypothetical protein MUC84_12605, partial [Solirubrobacteraceae bacterium]|nr:hypothetical protein [Solirubrobacteraceae bacterium]
RRITVNLAPADLRKEGPGFDLPIALAFLLATGQARRTGGGEVAALGELGLDGVVRPVSGVLAVVESLRRRGVGRVLVPAANAAEAALVQGVGVIPVGRLRDAVGALSSGACAAAERPDVGALLHGGLAGDVDFADVAGPAGVKRA